MCDEVIAFKPDLVITEKGVSDLAQHFLVKAGISVIRRVRKTDNNRIARYAKGYFWLVQLYKISIQLKFKHKINCSVTFLVRYLFPLTVLKCLI